MGVCAPQQEKQSHLGLSQAAADSVMKETIRKQAQQVVSCYSTYIYSGASHTTMYDIERAMYYI
jgi:hypothetical protein